MAGRFGELNENKNQVLLENSVPKTTEKATNFGKYDDKCTKEMSKTELNSCLKLFYTCARQKDWSYYKKTTMILPFRPFAVTRYRSLSLSMSWN